MRSRITHARQQQARFALPLFGFHSNRFLVPVGRLKVVATSWWREMFPLQIRKWWGELPDGSQMGIVVGSLFLLANIGCSIGLLFCWWIGW